jgi:hypothetical protein
MLRKGEIDAIIAVEGKPMRWLSQLADANLHFALSPGALASLRLRTRRNRGGLSAFCGGFLRF